MQREYPSAPLVGVGAVIVHQGRVLLIRRGAEPMKGRWVIPAAWLNWANRSPAPSAARRSKRPASPSSLSNSLSCLDRHSS